MYSLSPLDQGRLLAVGFYQLLERVTRAEIPTFLIASPRFLDDPRYLARRLRPLLGSVANEEASLAVHARISDAMKVDPPVEPNAMRLSVAQAITHPCDENAGPVSHAKLDQRAVRLELARMRRLQAETETALGSSRREVAEARLRGAGAREETRAARTALERAGQTMRIETERLDGEIAQLREQLAATVEQGEREAAELREQVIAANGQRDREVAQLNERLAELRVRTDSAQTDAEHWRRTLQEVYSSRSWRLTRGVRAIGRVMQIVRSAGLRR
jgi:hypothetical protein